MSYVNNGGMHYIHFAHETTALHEFDYDNQVGSSHKKIEKKNQTNMFTADGEMIIHKIGKGKGSSTGIKKPHYSNDGKQRDNVLIVHKKKNEQKEPVPEIKTEIKQNKPKKQESKISQKPIRETALGNDPRFKELFASLKQ